MINLTFHNDNTFRIHAGPRDIQLCKTVPGVWFTKPDPRLAEVMCLCPATLYHAVVLRSVFGSHLTYGADIAAWAEGALLDERLIAEARTSVPTLASALFDGWADEHQLYPYQRAGTAFMGRAGVSLLADDMGLGKGPQAISTVRLLADAGLDPYPALIVTTNSMKFKMGEEARKWCPGASVSVVDGSADKRRKALMPGHHFYCINWDTLRSHSRLTGYGSVSLTAAEKTEKELNVIPFRTIIADEAHKAKDPKAKQTRALWYLAKKAEYRIALTGTPIANRQLDLWAILHFLDPVVWSSRSDFQDRYVSGYTADWGFVPTGWQQQSKAELFRFVDRYMLRRTKEEVLPDLPAKTYEKRVLPLTTKQASLYKSMKKELMSEVDGEFLFSGDSLTKAGRLHQIASAAPVLEKRTVIDKETGEEREETFITELGKPSNKIDALLEIIEELGTKSVVVFALSKKLINLAESELDKHKITSVRVTGDESAEIRALNIQQFQEGLAQVALCTFGAGSEGITLTKADTAVFLQRPWSLVQSRQSEDRIHRIGQVASKVLIIDLVSEGTIDVEVHNTLVSKGETLQSVTRDKERLSAMLDGA